MGFTYKPSWDDRIEEAGKLLVTPLGLTIDDGEDRGILPKNHNFSGL